MHARKTQRLNDGYFEKHSYQSSKYSSSKKNYERDYERDRSSYRDRDISPSGGSINAATYRSQSPEVDSPSSRGHDINRSDHRTGGGFSYIQKMRDRDRDVYKKDKYSSDKRDRRGGNDRDSESHRTNHDRIDRRGGGGGAKLCSSSGGDKRSGSDDRDRERERERERDIRDSKRSERDRDLQKDSRRCNDREGQRDTRSDNPKDGRRGCNDRSDRGGGAGGGERGNERGERVARCGDWSEHVSSSGKMYYYNCKTEVSQWEKPKEWIDKERNLSRDQHREKEYRDKDRDRDREDRFVRSSYNTTNKHSSSRGNSRLRWNYDNEAEPASHRRRLDAQSGVRLADNADMDISPGDSTPTSEASYPLGATSHGIAPVGNNDQSTIPSSTIGLPNALPRLASHPNTINQMSSAAASSATLHLAAASLSSSTSSSNATATLTSASVGSSSQLSGNHRKLDAVSILQHQQMHHLSSVSSPNTSVSTNLIEHHHLNSNAPGPPKGSKEELMAKNALIMRQHHHALSQQHVGGSDPSSMELIQPSGGLSSVAGASSLRENALNSPLYNLQHSHGMMSPMNYTKSPLNAVNNLTGLSVSGKTLDGMNNASMGICSSNLVNIVINSSNPGSTSTSVPGEGPPTPTQELDMSGTTTCLDQQQRTKLEGAASAASLSNLQSCVTSSVQAGRCQGPEISPKLAKYFRADLITHVTNWHADSLEKQALKCSEETHLFGDLQCTKVCAELKCARSLVRITEITATLQEQKIMYLRQQIRRIEESKSQNSFMSDDL